MKKTCNQCGSEDLLEGLQVLDRGESNWKHILQIEMELNPAAIIRKKPMSAPVKARMCCSCGNIMFHAAADFAKGLKELTKAKGFNGDSSQHPRFREFLTEQPVYKHMEPTEQMSGFVRWMRTQGPDSAD